MTSSSARASHRPSSRHTLHAPCLARCRSERGVLGIPQMSSAVATFHGMPIEHGLRCSRFHRITERNHSDLEKDASGSYILKARDRIEETRGPGDIQTRATHRTRIDPCISARNRSSAVRMRRYKSGNSFNEITSVTFSFKQVDLLRSPSGKIARQVQDR